MGILSNCEVYLYILSKHPEIISKEEYRYFLRSSIERIKKGVDDIKEIVKRDSNRLEIETGIYGIHITYSQSESEKKERKENNKKSEYVDNFKKSIFNECSESYLGISEIEFENNSEIVEYL
ncbi:MAG: hypothetical protein QM532_03610 [Cyanobium sp. MAG06]|nr:hypothetical protein [Cyanobium sp. MAG06]